MQRLGLCQAVGLTEQQGQVVEAHGHCGMIRAIAVFVDVERAVMQQLGLCVFSAELQIERCLIE
jgi:hypothetical protein